ncbi:DUF4367 domain-containing protein [Ruminococcus sp. NK3A76]|uniref:DUF4367 domain-containing protein n=1 Tax=Ruminococcus sp. NK3A76 TaxID=877411 RepID=UPI0004912FA7|nr:DUF4367 domain-containing protein [Ruminococcus sp. NK3A76]
MNESNYKRAIFDALTPEYDDMLPQVENEHTFSKGFEKRMDKLVKRRSKPYYMMINTAAKRAACIIGIILIASFTTVMSVASFREAFKSFIVNTFEKYSVVRSNDEDSSVPETIKDIYGISQELIKDYSVTYEEKDDVSYNITYKSSNNRIIDFSQFTKNEFDIAINTENAKTITVEINGYEAMFYTDNHNYNHLIWDNGDYMIKISSNIGKDELISMAETVQKVE